MRTYNYFVVELEKLINDTIVTDSGLELYVDHKLNENGEFENRVTEGPVVCSPFKIDTGVKPGDTLYFHHLVVMQGGQVLTGDDKHYIVKCSKEALSNQAIAYKDQDTEEIKPLFGWSLLEPVEEEEFPSDLIEMVSLQEKLPTKGRVAFYSDELDDIGVEVGAVVGFKENRDYRIKIDGKEYYRTRIEDLLYVEEEVHNG
jgi:co-chaperonin GroES (HSP10)|tara:strand:- start:4192 stop:4794 length:603 start_codon:yes stop_codon:yes gene_type:complete